MLCAGLGRKIEVTHRTSGQVNERAGIKNSCGTLREVVDTIIMDDDQCTSMVVGEKLGEILPESKDSLGNHGLEDFA